MWKRSRIESVSIRQEREGWLTVTSIPQGQDECFIKTLATNAEEQCLRSVQIRLKSDDCDAGLGLVFGNPTNFRRI